MDGWGWVGMTLMTVVAVAIIGLVVWLIARQPEPRDPSARDQLDERLASGAIDPEEYRKRLDSLGA